MVREVELRANAGEPRESRRFRLLGELAAGGMATVHLGRLFGDAGFSRTVVIKRLHPQFAKDSRFVRGFMDEARLASRVRHTNVVSTIDVVTENDELFLIMDYVAGESLAGVMQRCSSRSERLPVPIAAAIASAVLRGLHAAHEAKDEAGRPLEVVHRDVSPQNVIVGSDGIARVVDFGVAYAEGRLQTTAEGEIKGKLAYMAPEQIRGGRSIDRRADVYAAAVVLWEMLTGKRLFQGEHQAETLDRVLSGARTRPSALVADVPPELDTITMKALSRSRDKRFATALEMAIAVEASAPVAPAGEISAWLERVAGDVLAERSARVEELEREAMTAAPTAASAAAAAAAAASAPTEVEAVRPSRRAWWLAVAAFLLGSGVAGVVVLGLGRGPSPAPPQLEAVATAPPSIAPLAASAPSSPVPSAPVVVDPAPPRASSPRSGGVKRAAKPSCNPPYVLDAQGDKKYKMECL